MDWTEELAAMWDKEMAPYKAPSLTGDEAKHVLAKLDQFLSDLKAGKVQVGPTTVTEFVMEKPDDL